MASKGVNKVILVGNLGQDPEVRYMPNGNAVANFSIATSESWKDQACAIQEKTEWHKCTAYRKLAEIIGEYLRQGSQVYVEGKLQTRKWQDQSGQDRYATEIIVDQMQMLGSKSNSGQSAPNSGKPAGSAQQKPDYRAHSGSNQKNPTYGKSQAPMSEHGFGEYSDDIPF